MQIGEPSLSENVEEKLQLRIKDYERKKSKLEKLILTIPDDLLTDNEIKFRDKEYRQRAAERNAEVNKLKQARQTPSDDDSFGTDDEVISGNLAAIRAGKKR